MPRFAVRFAIGSSDAKQRFVDLARGHGWECGKDADSLIGIFQDPQAAETTLREAAKMAEAKLTERYIMQDIDGEFQPIAPEIPVIELQLVDRTASHEAGHAVIAMACGFQVACIQVHQDGVIDGFTHIKVPDRATDEEIAKLLCFWGAGSAGEYLLQRDLGIEEPIGGWANDLKQARRFKADLDDDKFLICIQAASQILQVPERLALAKQLASLLIDIGSIDAEVALQSLATKVPSLSPAEISFARSYVLGF